MTGVTGVALATVILAAPAAMTVAPAATSDTTAADVTEINAADAGQAGMPLWARGALLPDAGFALFDPFEIYDLQDFFW